MTYTAGLVGTGRIGRIHADLYATVEGIELVAIAEIDDDLRAARGDAWGIDPDRRFETHDGLLTTSDLDVVSVATPTSLHRDVVLAAADSPAAPSVILCEKPLAESGTGARAMVDACAAAGTELVVDHTLRFSDAYRSLRAAIQGGYLGDVHSIQLHAGGSLMRLGTHYVDLLSFLLDASVVEVRGGYCSSFSRTVGDTDVDDRWGGGTYLLDDGTFAQVDLTRSGSVANRLTVVGDAGMVAVQGSDASSIFSREMDAAYWRIEDGEHVPAALPDSFEDLWARDMAANTRGADENRGMYAAQRQFDALGAHLVELLDGTVENRSPGAQGVHVVDALVATFVSHETGSAVPLPLPDALQSTRIRTR